jgi:hypothetical protein
MTAHTPEVRAISSMATRQVLIELADDWQIASSRVVKPEAVGGVDDA